MQSMVWRGVIHATSSRVAMEKKVKPNTKILMLSAYRTYHIILPTYREVDGENNTEYHRIWRGSH